MRHQRGVTTIAATLLLASTSTVFASLTIARNREYRSGVTLAEVTLERYPTPSARHALAEHLLLLGRRDEAMRHLWAAVPGAPRAHYTLGLELYKEGRLDEAIGQLQAFVTKQPRLVWVIEAYGVLGEAYEAKQDWPSAIEAFTRVLTLSPANPRAERALADVLLAAGRPEEAIAHYRRVVSASAVDADALNQLGMALGSTDRFGEAVDVFRQAAAIDPRNGSVQHNLALALCKRGTLTEAVVHARAATALQPDNAESQALLEQLLVLQERCANGNTCFVC